MRNLVVAFEVARRRNDKQPGMAVGASRIEEIQRMGQQKKFGHQWRPERPEKTEKKKALPIQHSPIS
jgi:hypothetical protein